MIRGMSNARNGLLGWTGPGRKQGSRANHRALGFSATRSSRQRALSRAPANSARNFGQNSVAATCRLEVRGPPSSGIPLPLRVSPRHEEVPDTVAPPLNGPWAV